VPGFALAAPYPNPTTGATTIRFTLPARHATRVEVYDVTGRHVRTLADGVLAADTHRYVWDGLTENGTRVSNGIYFARVVAGPFEARKKVEVRIGRRASVRRPFPVSLRAMIVPVRRTRAPASVTHRYAARRPLRMSREPSPEVFTRLLRELADDPSDGERLGAVYEAVYAELHALAESQMRPERVNHTLTPTALVHEAYLKMTAASKLDFESRAHFLGSAARAMRQILVNHAEARRREKRGGGRERLTFTDVEDSRASWEFEVIAVDEALRRYAAVDERASRITELKVFAGMTSEEIARILGVSRRTVTNDWRVARAWLTRELRLAR
jgi:RNA polymerase sigma factor (TIGR02999 family)